MQGKEDMEKIQLKLDIRNKNMNYEWQWQKPFFIWHICLKISYVYISIDFWVQIIELTFFSYTFFLGFIAKLCTEFQAPITEVPYGQNTYFSILICANNLWSRSPLHLYQQWMLSLQKSSKCWVCVRLLHDPFCNFHYSILLHKCFW